MDSNEFKEIRNKIVNDLRSELPDYIEEIVLDLNNGTLQTGFILGDDHKDEETLRELREELNKNITSYKINLYENDNRDKKIAELKLIFAKYMVEQINEELEKLVDY